MFRVVFSRSKHLALCLEKYFSAKTPLPVLQITFSLDRDLLPERRSSDLIALSTAINSWFFCIIPCLWNLSEHFIRSFLVISPLDSFLRISSTSGQLLLCFWTKCPVRLLWFDPHYYNYDIGKTVRWHHGGNTINVIFNSKPYMQHKRLHGTQLLMTVK